MGTLEEATRFGEVVVLAIPWRKKEDLPQMDLFKGKIVIDAMNPYSAIGNVIDLGDRTSSEEVARLLPGARLVKAFNTMGFADLQSGAFRSGKDRWAIFVAGDDAEAKRIVSGSWRASDSSPPTPVRFGKADDCSSLVPPSTQSV